MRRSRQAERPITLDHRAEVGTLDQPHRNEEVTPSLAAVIDRQDVRVVNGCGEPRFAHEASHVVGVRIRDREKLQRYHPPKRDLFGSIYPAHSSAAEQLFNSEPTQLGSAQRIQHPPTSAPRPTKPASAR